MAIQLTRRKFIKTGAAGILSLGAAAHPSGLLANLPQDAADSKSRVILARDPLCINDRNQCDPQRVKQLFDRSLMALSGSSDTKTAWGVLGLKSHDTVAVKINCNTWTVSLLPHPEFLNALFESLGQVIPLNNIIVYERTSGDLRDGGFTINQSKTGVRFFGNDQGGGYDKDEALTRIITDTCTKIINLASFKCVESDFGLSLFFKNHIGSLKDEDMPRCHGNPDFLAAVNARPSIRKKTLLLLSDGLRATYKRGIPWYWGGIIMGQDPVASELAAVDAVNEKREQLGIEPLDIPRHLVIAQSTYKLGKLNPAKIEKINLNL